MTTDSTSDPCLGCARLEAGAEVVQLAGREPRTVCTWCPAWREETRARHALALRILAMPDKAARQNTIADVERTDGSLAAERLRAAVLAAWEARRAKV